MAHLECHFFSHTLGLSTSLSAVIPQPQNATPGRRFRTLYLLHGLSDDHTIWMRRTSLERYAEARELAVIMPEVGRSFYTDMAHGLPYYTFVSQELLAVTRQLFPLSGRRQDTFVAGLSMGGYGALKLALSSPQDFAAAGSFSGALDVASFRDQQEPQALQEWKTVFGDLEAIQGSANDLFALAQALSAGDRRRLRLYQCCGTEDFLYTANLRFRDHARAQGLDLTYEEEPGEHEWGYWDRKVQSFLAWLFAPPARRATSREHPGGGTRPKGRSTHPRQA